MFEEIKSPDEKKSLFGSMFGIVKNIFEKDSYSDPKTLTEKKNN